MSSAIITLIGLYQYDNSLFDGLTLPDGIDRDLTIDSILMNGGEYEVLYSNPELLKELIKSWSLQWYNVFSQWARATEDMKSIQPLENYDRYEEWTDDGTHSDTQSNSSHNGTTDHNQTTGTNESRETGNSSGTNTVSAYDSNTLVNDRGNSSSDTNNINGTTSSTSNGNTTSDSTFNQDTSGTTSSKHVGHLHGNIGVTTAGQMYKEFYDVMRNYGNIYESISTVFLTNFVIPIL